MRCWLRTWLVVPLVSPVRTLLYAPLELSTALGVLPSLGVVRVVIAIDRPLSRLLVPREGCQCSSE